MNAKKGGIGFRHAFAGIYAIIRSERNFKIHLVCAIVAVILGFLMALSRQEWIVVIFAIALVMQAEILNTAIEKTIDYIKPEYHPAAKLIKDLSAGAVLVTALGAFVVGILLFVPKLLEMLF